MRTLTLHTAADLVERWRSKASVGARVGTDYDRGMAHAYRVAATELEPLCAVSMELEAAHHGDPEPVDDLCQNPSHDGHRLAEYTDCMTWDRDDIASGNVWPESDRDLAARAFGVPE